MTEYAVMPKADYQDACNAVREKTGGTVAIKSGGMAEMIRSIQAGGASVEMCSLYAVFWNLNSSSASPLYVVYLTQKDGALSTAMDEVTNDSGDTVYYGLEAVKGSPVVLTNQNGLNKNNVDAVNIDVYQVSDSTLVFKLGQEDSYSLEFY